MNEGRGDDRRRTSCHIDGVWQSECFKSNNNIIIYSNKLRSKCALFHNLNHGTEDEVERMKRIQMKQRPSSLKENFVAHLNVSGCEFANNIIIITLLLPFIMANIYTIFNHLLLVQNEMRLHILIGYMMCIPNVSPCVCVSIPI